MMSPIFIGVLAMPPIQHVRYYIRFVGAATFWKYNFHCHAIEIFCYHATCFDVLKIQSLVIAIIWLLQ